MNILSTFLFGIVAYAALSAYTLFGWVLIFFPGLRTKVDGLLQSILGKESSEDLLYKHGPSFAHSEPALSFWWMGVKYQMIVMIGSSLVWLVMFKLFHAPGPAWLQTFTLKGILSIQVVATVLYVLASAITNPVNPDSIEPDIDDNK